MQQSVVQAGPRSMPLHQGVDTSQRQFVFAQMHAAYHAASAGKSLPRLSLSDEGLDQALGGGVLCRRVHLVTSAAFSCANAAFSLALVAMMLRSGKASGPIIWCGPARGGPSGHLFGAGLAEIGLRPEQFIFVRESHPLRRMAACEEALATSGLAAVIHEYGPLYEKPDLWHKSARRLQLACERGSATAFMIGGAGSASGFESAWHISPSIMIRRDSSDWRPLWHADLRHARGGVPCEADLIWDKQTGSFLSASAPHKPHNMKHIKAAPFVSSSSSSLWAEPPYHQGQMARDASDWPQSA